MRTLINSKRRDDGFTVTELLVALVIFGLLAGIAVPIYINQQNTAKEGALKSMLSTAAVVLKQEKTSNNGLYPRNLPYDVPIPAGTDLKYSTSPEMDKYCIEASDGSITLYLSAENSGDATIGTEECSYDSGGIMRPVLSGHLSSDNRPILAWTEVEDATGYELSIESDAGVETINLEDTTWTGETMPISHSFVVRTIIGEEKSSPSNRVRLDPTRSKPTLKPTLEIIDISQTKNKRFGTLKWNIVPWATGYRVINATNGSILHSTPSTTYPVSADVGDIRNFQVFAYNEIGESPRSDTVTLKGPLPGQPELNVDFHEHPSDPARGVQATLSWPPVRGAVDYKIMKNGVLLSTVPQSAGDIYYVDTTPWNSGMVAYSVVPVTRSGEDGEESQVWSYDTTMGLPIAPSLSVNGGSLRWNHVEYAENYIIQQRDAVPGAAWYTIGVEEPGSALTPGSFIQWPMTVPAARRYEFRVAARGILGQGNWSNTVSIQTNPSAPTLTSVRVRTTTQGPVMEARANCAQSNTRPYFQRRDTSNGGSWSAWSAFTAATTAPSPNINISHNIPIRYGYTVRNQIYVKCVANSYSPELSSGSTLGDVTTPVNVPPAPVATTTLTSYTGLNATNARITGTGRITAGCVSGTQLQYSLNSAAWTNMTGTSIARFTDVAWGSSATFGYRFRCLAASTPSAMSTPSSVSLTATVPAVASVNGSTYQTRFRDGQLRLRSSGGSFGTCAHGLQLQTRWKRQNGSWSTLDVEHPRDISSSNFPHNFRPAQPSSEFRCRATGSARGPYRANSRAMRYKHVSSWTDAT